MRQCRILTNQITAFDQDVRCRESDVFAAHWFNKTGNVKSFLRIKVTAVKAEYSSLIGFNNPATGKNESNFAGEAMGDIIELENGLKIWRMGDTGLSDDMKFISDRYKTQ